MSHKKHLAIISFLSAAVPVSASDLNINGFLSVGASMLDDDKVAIAGYDTNGGFKQDTILGLQVSKQVNDSSTVTGQLVSRGTDDYKTESAWAYVSYAANDNLDLRMGRLRVPFYYYSDFLEVGYAYDWVRPPSEVYNIPFSSIDGVDATYNFSSGQVDNSIQVYYGRYNRAGSGVDLKNFTGLVLNSSIGNLSFRGSYHRLEIDSDGTGTSGAPNKAAANAISTAFAPLLTAKGHSAASIASAKDDFLFTGQEVGFYGIASAYDNGDISLIGEVTQSFGDLAFFPKTTNYLVKAAKRFSDMTPHITYSSTSTDKENGINGDIQEAMKLEHIENSITLGLRYDYDSSTALKLEVQQNNEDKRSLAGKIDESGMLYSVAIDLVF